MEKIKVVLKPSQVRDAEMRKQGISPAQLALKPGTRVEPNRKKLAQKGHTKHKGTAIPGE